KASSSGIAPARACRISTREVAFGGGGPGSATGVALCCRPGRGTPAIVGPAAGGFKGNPVRPGPRKKSSDERISGTFACRRRYNGNETPGAKCPLAEQPDSGSLHLPPESHP